jgi:hypothetical protein
MTDLIVADKMPRKAIINKQKRKATAAKVDNKQVMYHIKPLSDFDQRVTHKWHTSTAMSATRPFWCGSDRCPAFATNREFIEHRDSGDGFGCRFGMNA